MTCGASESACVVVTGERQEFIWYHQDPTGSAARYGNDAFASSGFFNGSALYRVFAPGWCSNLAGWIRNSEAGLNNVRILNLWNGANARQDMLVMIPLPPPPCPGKQDWRSWEW